MQSLSKDVMAAAQRISEGLGWTGRHAAQAMGFDVVTGGGARDSSPAPKARARGHSGGRRK